MRPARLRPGDIIGLVSPASPPVPEKIEGSVRYFESRGYRVTVGKHAANEQGYLAGTDKQRVGDLNRMLADKRIKAIIALRGGYGTPRLLPGVDYESAQRNPKILAGFSDITALQWALFRKTGLVTFSSALPAVELWKDPDPFTEESFWRMLTSDCKGLVLPRDGEPTPPCERAGKTKGILLPGNLSLITSLLGTPYAPSFRDTILVTEDVDEYPHRLDRMFVQLRNAGVLQQIAGMILGQFNRCEPLEPGKPHIPVPEILRTVASWVEGPVMSGYPYGHVRRRFTLPVGCRVELDSKAGLVTLLESPATES